MSNLIGELTMLESEVIYVKNISSKKVTLVCGTTIYPNKIKKIVDPETETKSQIKNMVKLRILEIED